jgi:hypothetical protein
MNCPEGLHLLRGIFRQVLVGDGLDAERAEDDLCTLKTKDGDDKFPDIPL